MTNNESREVCQDVATQQLIRGIEKEHWMVIVISSDNGVVTLEETTCAFPASDHETAAKLFAQALNGKLEVDVPEPLPLADHLVEKARQDYGVGEPIRSLQESPNVEALDETALR